MANSILDLIKQQVTAQAGNVEIPAQAKNQVLNGLTDSIFGSLTQTVAKVGGIEQIKSLLTGKTNAAQSPITALIPTIMGKLSGILKDQDGDGDVDFQDILITLKGGNKTQTASTGGGLLGGILGKVLGGNR